MIKYDSRKKAFTCLLAAIAVFAIIVAGIFIVQVATGACAFAFDRSISRYVGLRAWSAVLFLLTNCFVCYCIVRFLFSENVPKLYRYVGFIFLLSLLLVSAFPIGLFEVGISDKVHNIVSRTLFVSMLIHTLAGVFCFRKRRAFILPNLAVLAIYMAVLVIVLFFSELFWSFSFIFEFVMIFAYFASLLTAAKECFTTDKNSTVSADNNEKLTVH